MKTVVANGQSIPCANYGKHWTFEHGGWYFTWDEPGSDDFAATILAHDQPEDSEEKYNEADCSDVHTLREAVLWAIGFVLGNAYGSTPEDEVVADKIS